MPSSTTGLPHRSGLTRLRVVQKAHRLGDTKLGDILYRVYVSGLLGLFAFYLALDLVDGVTSDSGGIGWAGERGPLWLGFVAAVALAAGVRSGANGGPLAMDELEVHHVLLSPLDRGLVLSAPTRRLLAAAAAIGAIVGAAAGELASRQLPGHDREWVAAGLLAGASIAVSGVGAALLAATSGVSRRLAALIASLVVGWAVTDLVVDAETSPTSGFGRLALWPLGHRPSSAVALFLPIVLAWLGWARIGGLPIERAHRRSLLVAQFRFALAQQDIRGLLLLRRQLAFETPRNRPWFTLKVGRRFEHRFPVVVRDLHSYARWPLARVLRVIGLAVVAGLALAGMWQGTSALIGVVGAALYLAAIEVVEPLSQELDHPGILDLLPIGRGPVMLGHIASAVVAMTGVWMVTGAAAMAFTLDWRVGVAVGVASVPAATAAVAAAGLSIKRVAAPSLVVLDEMAGPRILFRLVWPPLLTLLGALPVLVGRNALDDGDSVTVTTLNTAALVAAVAGAAVAWIRYRDDLTAATLKAGEARR